MSFLMASMNKDSPSSESPGSWHCSVCSIVAVLRRKTLLQSFVKWLNLLHLRHCLPYAGHCFLGCVRPQFPHSVGFSGGFLEALVKVLWRLLLFCLNPKISAFVSAIYWELFFDSASAWQIDIALSKVRSSTRSSRCRTSSEHVPQTLLSLINWSSKSPNRQFFAISHSSLTILLTPLPPTTHIRWVVRHQAWATVINLNKH